MVIQIKVPEELLAQARARGVPLEAYIQEILAKQAATSDSGTKPLQTPEQIHAWLDALAQFSDRIPPLPGTISREWIYQDHD